MLLAWYLSSRRRPKITSTFITYHDYYMCSRWSLPGDCLLLGKMLYCWTLVPPGELWTALSSHLDHTILLLPAQSLLQEAKLQHDRIADSRRSCSDGSCLLRHVFIPSKRGMLHDARAARH